MGKGLYSAIAEGYREMGPHGSPARVAGSPPAPLAHRNAGGPSPSRPLPCGWRTSGWPVHHQLRWLTATPAAQALQGLFHAGGESFPDGLLLFLATGGARSEERR